MKSPRLHKGDFQSIFMGENFVKKFAAGDPHGLPAAFTYN